MENTDFVIEHIDEEVKIIADQPSVVSNYPANTDFFIENIDSNVISIAQSLNIEASEVDFRPANTDFFIENIDKNVIAIAESMSLTPSEVDFRPANTDFFVENINKNLIEIAESLSLSPYEVTIRPANTDMFIENIDKNVTLIKGSTNVITVSGEYININLPDGGKVKSGEFDGNATQTTYSGKNLLPIRNTPRTINGVTFTPRDDGSVLVNGTATAQTSYPLNINSTSQSKNVTLPAGTYTIDDGSTTQGVFVQVWYDEGGGNLYSITTFTTTAETHLGAYIRVNSGVTANNVVMYPMLNSGSTATSYEPYVGGIPAPNPDYPMSLLVVSGNNTVKIDVSDDSQEFPIDLGIIELAGVGEIQPNGLPKYCDTIKQVDGKWYIEKQVGKTTLDGSEEYIWNYNSGTYSGFYRTVDSILTDGMAKVDDARLSKSNNFTCESTTTTWTGPGRFGFSSTWTMWFELMDNTATTYQDFNAWLSTHPTTIYYPLATPTTAEITNQTLIDQLEALAGASLSQGVITIFTEIVAGNAMPTLKLVIEKY